MVRCLVAMLSRYFESEKRGQYFMFTVANMFVIDAFES